MNAFVFAAEIPGNIDTLAGGGITGALVVVMVTFLRRTKDADERRDEGTRMIVEDARSQAARAWEERDRLLAERDTARQETERIRGQYESARREFDREQLRFDMERRQWQERPS